MPQKRKLIQGAPSTEGMAPLKKEAPNRPLGQDKFADAMDFVLGMLGVNDPFNPEESSASVLGGGASVLPLGAMAGVLGKGDDALRALNTLLDSAMGRVMSSRPERRKADAAAIRRAYDEYKATRGGPEVKPDVSPLTLAGPVRQPKAHIGDQQMRDWATKLLAVAQKFGYTPDGSELGTMFDLAKAMSPARGQKSISPADFPRAYRNTIPHSVGGTGAGTKRRHPLRVAMDHPDFFRTFNSQFAEAPKLSGQWNRANSGNGVRRRRGSKVESGSEGLPAEFVPVGEEDAFNVTRPKPVVPDVPSGPVPMDKFKVKDPGGPVDDDPIHNPLVLLEQKRGGHVLDPAQAREAAELRLGLMDEGPMKEAYANVLRRYPRLLGHVRELGISPRLGEAGTQGAAAFTNMLRHGEDTPYNPAQDFLSDIDIRNVGDEEDITETFLHELTHAAQQLRGGQTFERAYISADNNYGYWTNPFEQNARRSASATVRSIKEGRPKKDFRGVFGHILEPYDDNPRLQIGFDTRASKPSRTSRSGVVPGEDPDDRTDFSRIMPAYRDKAGMAVDVLEEMGTPEVDQGWLYSPEASALRAKALETGEPIPDDAVRYKPFTKLDDFAQNAKVIDNWASQWARQQAHDVLTTDPVNFVGDLRSLDSMRFDGPNPLEGGPGEIDLLIQDLANYFTSPRFDPFGPGKSERHQRALFDKLFPLDPPK